MAETRLKLYKVTNDTVEECRYQTYAYERELQTLVETHMEFFFGVRFIKSEYAITDGRMDSIGLDENFSPVIFEYKRSLNENVINQGLFYLDWLLDHKGNFKVLVQETLGHDVADQIDWSQPSVVCIASDFTKFDLHAVKQINRNIKLVKYSRFDNDLLSFEHLNAPTLQAADREDVDSVSLGETNATTSKRKTDPYHTLKVEKAPDDIKTLYKAVCEFAEELGDDVVKSQQKYYLAFKRVKNFMCVEVYRKNVVLRLKLDPKAEPIEEGFSRDMSTIGHYGTGDYEITLTQLSDFERAQPYIRKAYDLMR